jgi:hypothetical protein
VPTTEPPTKSRGRRHAGLGLGVAVAAALLCIGGPIAFAMATASASPVSVSVTWSGPGGPDHSPSGPTSTSTTTTTATPVAATGESSSVEQILSVSILPGPLTVSPTSELVALTDLRAFGHSTPFYRGDLFPITVDDARGSLVGWRTTVSLQTVSGLDAAQLASTRLCVSPHPTTFVAGNPADIVRSSPRACAGPGDPIAVFFAASGGGGGEYSDTPGISLALPDGTSSSAVTASLVVSVS